MRRTLKKHTFLVIFRHVFPVEKSVPKIGVKNRPKKIGLQKVLEKLCSQLVLQPKNATLCQKWCAHDCIRNQKCCDRKFGTVLKKSRTEQNSCYCPDPKPPPPTPVRPRGAARTGEGGRLVGNLIGPRCLCEIFAMGWGALVLVAGPLLEPPVPPLVRFGAAPGPWCGASVGTTGSAPCALACRCFPKNVRTQLLGNMRPENNESASWALRFVSLCVHGPSRTCRTLFFRVYGV